MQRKEIFCASRADGAAFARLGLCGGMLNRRKRSAAGALANLSGWYLALQIPIPDSQLFKREGIAGWQPEEGEIVHSNLRVMHLQPHARRDRGGVEEYRLYVKAFAAAALSLTLG